MLFRKWFCHHSWTYAFISKDECNNAYWLPSTFRRVHLPTPYHRHQIASDTQLNSKTVLYVGALFIPSNIQAVKWYLDYVHPHLLSIPGYEFVVAGNTRNVSHSLIKFIESQPSVKLLQSPHDLSPIYHSSGIFVNPSINGSGVKIKTLNAIENSLPVVSTQDGVSGLGLIPEQDYLLASSPQEFVQSIIQLINSRSFRKQIIDSSHLRLSSVSSNMQMINSFIS